MKWLSLVIGGVVGTLARYCLSGLVYRVVGIGFPYGTLFVNSIGCLILGFLYILAEEKFLLSPNVRLLLMIGFCGAFTTFSTFMLETVHLLRDGESIQAFFNILVSVLLGFLALKGGILLGRWI